MLEEILGEQTRKTKCLITEEYISRVSTPSLEMFDAEECSRISELHKRLLKIAMKENDSNEVGFLVSLVDWTYLPTLGGEKGITIRHNSEAKELLITAPVRSLIFMHNHPRNSVFSERDLNSFLTADTILMVTVVCNNGRTYYLAKSNEFNKERALRYYDELFENPKIEHTVLEFLRTCKKVALSFYYGGN